MTKHMDSKLNLSQKDSIICYRTILEKVYCDGQVSGAGSTAETNYKNIEEALADLKKVVEL